MKIRHRKYNVNRCGSGRSFSKVASQLILFVGSYPICCVASLRAGPVGCILYNMYTVKANGPLFILYFPQNISFISNFLWGDKCLIRLQQIIPPVESMNSDSIAHSHSGISSTSVQPVRPKSLSTSPNIKTARSPNHPALQQEISMTELKIMHICSTFLLVYSPYFYILQWARNSRRISHCPCLDTSSFYRQFTQMTADHNWRAIASYSIAPSTLESTLPCHGMP